MSTPRARAPYPFKTVHQEQRARDLASMAPLGRQPIDVELDALGWTQRYDGNPLATELTPTALASMFDEDGNLVEYYAPKH